MVNEFLDIFHDDLIRLLLDREIQFTIDMILGTTPISITLYGIASS